MDVSESMLSIANKKYRHSIVNENNHSLNLYNCDMRYICKQCNIFWQSNLNKLNLIILYYSIIHIPRNDHLNILKDCNQLLMKNNGYLVICTGIDDLKFDIGLWDNEPMFWSHFSKNKNIELIKQCGFEIVRSKDIFDYTDNTSKHLFIIAKKIENIKNIDANNDWNNNNNSKKEKKSIKAKL